MGIGSIARVALNYVKAHPLRSAVIGGTLGLGTGLVLHKAATTSQKEAQEQMDRFVLTDPFMNPFGWYNHAINPTNVTPNEYDNPTVRYIINHRKKQSDNPDVERVMDFYKNGGKGVTFET
jgi:hypothetical protein